MRRKRPFAAHDKTVGKQKAQAQFVLLARLQQIHDVFGQSFPLLQNCPPASRIPQKVDVCWP